MKALIRNIGQIVSGDIAQPLLDGDSIAIVDGKIAAIGRGLDDDADTVIDARGSTVVPGLIDSHVPSGLRRLHAAAAHHRLHRLRAATAASPP